jgi:hypothetical protein
VVIKREAGKFRIEGITAEKELQSYAFKKS